MITYNKKVHSFTVKIISKIQSRNYQKKIDYYQLKVESKDINSNEIRVYQNEVSEELWDKLISDKEFVGKTYLFFCEKYSVYYHLRDWKEIK